MKKDLNEIHKEDIRKMNEELDRDIRIKEYLKKLKKLQDKYKDILIYVEKGGKMIVELNKQKDELEKAAEVILDLVCQYAYTRDEKKYFSDGLSVMENAFIWLVKHGYAKGNSERIKLTNKALAFWRENENKKLGDELGGNLYTTWEGREDE